MPSLSFLVMVICDLTFFFLVSLNKGLLILVSFGFKTVTTVTSFWLVFTDILYSFCFMDFCFCHFLSSISFKFHSLFFFLSLKAVVDGHGFGWTPEVGDGQGGLAYCDSWGHKESDSTE